MYFFDLMQNQQQPPKFMHNLTNVVKGKEKRKQFVEIILLGIIVVYIDSSHSVSFFFSWSTYDLLQFPRTPKLNSVNSRLPQLHDTIMLLFSIFSYCSLNSYLIRFVSNQIINYSWHRLYLLLVRQVPGTTQPCCY